MHCQFATEDDRDRALRAPSGRDIYYHLVSSNPRCPPQTPKIPKPLRESRRGTNEPNGTPSGLRHALLPVPPPFQLLAFIVPQLEQVHHFASINVPQKLHSQPS